MSYFRPNIQSIAGYAPGFQPNEASVVKLNTNENPYPPSPKVAQAVAAMSEDQMRRYPPALGDAFREAAAALNGVSPESILCCNGGDDLLTIAMRAFCDENRPVAYPCPTYSLYPVLAALQNCKTVEVDFDETFTLPRALRDTGAALTIVCNPNAPSGSLVGIDELHELADALKKKSILLIDEAYVDFAECNCIGLVERTENVIVLRSMSKGYSLAGIRFGYAVANKALIGGLTKVKDSYNVNAVSITAATAAILDQNYFKENVEKVKSERKRLTLSLRELGVEVPDSETNFVLAKCPGGNAGDIYNALARKHIYVRYFDLPGLRDKMRITIGTQDQNDKLVAALTEILS